MTSKNTNISIVTPSYNQGKYIQETITSILSQDYPHVESIVMDGGSTDETVAILKRHDGRIVWRSEKDRGQTHAINKGLAIAMGEVVAYLNSDDTYMPGAFTKVVNYFNDHPDIGMVYGEGYHINEQGGVIERYPTEPFNFERLRETCFICQPTVFLRRQVYDTVGPFDESLHFGMDYDYWIRVGKQFKIGYIPDYLACSRLYLDAKTLRNKVQVHEENLRMLRKHFKGVLSKWTFDWAHAVLGDKIKRDTPFHNWLFTTALCAIASYKFLRQYGRIPAKDMMAMARWFGGTSRELWRSWLK
ncbi:MAG TPA: glycosyltransferase family 2 protein [Bacteroidota bacterium]|jgi:glycosyltransferase involved in cell wall biosynthesis